MDNRLALFVLKRAIGMGIIFALAAVGAEGLAMFYGIIYVIATIRQIKKYNNQ